MAELRVVVVGAGGRMGRALIRAVADESRMRLVGALERPGSAVLGMDAGTLAGIEPLGVAVTDHASDLFDGADAVLDFTSPAATLAYAELAGTRGLVHVIGTTGIEAQDEETLRLASHGARIVKSGNMSLGVNLLAGLVRQAAAALGPDFDLEILEMHHRHKVDAPSGTALLLGEAAAEGREIALGQHSVRVRDGHTGPRERGTIGFATLRGGSVVGDHMVVLAGEGERIELTHRAENRTIFARGAVRAALWAHEQKPGLYSMADVLGLST
ncbi:dihydrodipicolinate reductase [Faunimonas pinastri]|uniref:4-hydroxy-tetrahydrodipicolinate reductase n=1 Tax=Faunimonas pinastri TaxID=1855383 RepID=A0A1H9GQB1_9HYPH|nr:4-hydroxy-tetrahydrodipicolinate reductase [Faunimonas pinastri]SEQ52178.1 dihydrodipicolinate reductase [Faunimonas pinastri]